MEGIIKLVETRNTALIIIRYQQLVQYSNKLKLHLAKSCQSIQKITKIEKENIALNQENQTLRKEKSK